MLKRICAIAALLVVTGAGLLVMPGAGADATAKRRTTVSRNQYNILINQCRYANSVTLRKKCRAYVRKHYRIGKWNPDLDCRTYSGITVCGKLMLSRRERRCVTLMVRAGLTRRRAEVECYAFV
ncbi:hypothetical protein [Sphaerisporangium fuscum]|uniref:hypothetical protein n=1 Tax=Sphaerisporangium fuscum TaxID=2835868 RepID=UPI002029A709|nr:hypothetical protein [Sphaerisporangium fuscum]